MENIELDVKVLLLSDVTNKKAFLDFNYYYNKFLFMPDVEMIHISYVFLSYSVFLLLMIFMGNLSSAHQTSKAAGNFFPLWEILVYELERLSLWEWCMW